MEMIVHLWNTLIGTLVPFLFVLMIVVYVHEMGHYLVGRACGIGVKAFSIGFGPELFGWTNRNGTRWKVCAIPLGGYVRFVGDVGASSAPDGEALVGLSESERRVAFPVQPLWKKALTVVAGPVANFILAIVILTGFFVALGKVVVEPVVGAILPDLPAQEQGIEVGDRFVMVDGSTVKSFADVQNIVNARAGDPIDFVLERKGEQFSVRMTPKLQERQDALGNTVRLGLIGVGVDTSPEQFTRISLSPVQAVQEGILETGRVIDRTLLFMKRFVMGREDKCQLGGPVKIAEMAGKAAQKGITWLISLMAMLSIGIGILNLMPVPPLDGGHLMMYGIEAVIRRPLPPAFQDWAYRIGFMAVAALMLLVMWNDLVAC